MAADRLREAARVLRERAKVGGPTEYPAPWRPVFDQITDAGHEFWEVDCSVDGLVAEWLDQDLATYIATMHPGVGLALADLLEDEAHAVEVGDPVSSVSLEDVADQILGGAA